MSKIIKQYEEQPTGMSSDYAADFYANPWSSFQDYRKKQLTIIHQEREQDLFLYNINTKEEFRLSLIPDTLAESYSSRIVTQSPFGVAHPINYYVGGDSKSLSFSFDMHEDLHNVNGSIYELLERLKDMSRAKVINQLLKAPLVYFQLGTQFAGLGHINVNYDYKKPFRNGRYIYVSCSISFTFHEEFEAEPVDFGGTFVQDQSLGLNVDFGNLTDGFESYDDFAKESFDYDYIVTQIYSDSKLTAYFNTLVTNIESHYDDISKLTVAPDPEEVEQYISDIQSGNLPTGSTWINQNPYAVDLINLFFKFKTIINPVFSTIIIKGNLVKLLYEISDLKEAYFNSYTGDNQYDQQGYGWYEIMKVVGGSGYTFTWIQMKEKEKQEFEDALGYLEKLVNHQIAIYSIVTGAGE
jgi:hypothetical protein